jgi:uncharacterized integral membrane protein (TIGR00698 family)
MIDKQKTTLKKIIFFGFIILLAFPFPWASSLLSLVLGLSFAIILGNPFEGKTSKITNYLLQFSVVGIGFGTSLTTATEIGKESFYWVFIFVLLTLFIGYLLGKFLNVERKISDLITSGTSICGGSAIAAISPVIKANEKQISVSLGTIFVLSALGLFIFPIVGEMLQMSGEDFGLWAGLAIHDTGSVLGAASDYGKGALEVATTVKLARVLFIIPLVFLGSILYKGKETKFTFPYFIIFFLLAMYINSSFPDYTENFKDIKFLTKKGLQITLFLIGASLSVKNLKSVGVKPFLQGFLLWLLISILSLVIVINL